MASLYWERTLVLIKLMHTHHMCVFLICKVYVTLAFLFPTGCNVLWVRDALPHSALNLGLG